MTDVTHQLACTHLSVEPQAHLEFGAGAVDRLPAAIEGVGPPRAFVVTDRGLRSSGIVDRVLDLLAAAGVEHGVYDAVEPNPTTANIDQAAELVRRFGAGCVVALGGGSVLDAAKGVALLATNPGLAADYDYRATPQYPGKPVVAVPTTAGTGAETNGFGVIEDPRAHAKVYLGHRSVRPRTVILDPELTVGLPPGATAATGMDALVHGIESLASRGSSPLSAAYANQAISLVGSSLRAAVSDGDDLEARSGMLLASHLAGRALSLSGLGLVHGIAHAVTSHTGAVHGLALTAVLAEVMERSLEVARTPYACVAQSLGGRSADPVAAVEAVREIADDVHARTTLSRLGVQQAMVPGIAAGALADIVTSNHPRRFDRAEIEDVLAAAW